jgi:hypothetical protein
VLSELSDKNADIGSIAERALKDRDLLSELLEGLKSRVSTKSAEETLRYNCYKVLMLISQTHGEVLYPKWEYIIGLLNSENSYHKMSAINLIASLTRVDTENRFNKIFDRYYSLLDDKSMIVAMYVAGNSGQIARAKPQLEHRITTKLLSIAETHHPEGRKELIKGSAIEAFGQYFSEATDKEKILEFVEEQQNSSSPKTRKLAKEFLKKWGGT